MSAFINPPKKCDTCDSKLEIEFYDCYVTGGRWGYICPACFKAFNCKLGTGRGQHYLRFGDTDFHKVLI